MPDQPQRPAATVRLKDGTVRQITATLWESELNREDWDWLKLELQNPLARFCCDIVTDAGVVPVRLKTFLEKPRVIWEKIPVIEKPQPFKIPAWMLNPNDNGSIQ